MTNIRKVAKYVKYRLLLPECGQATVEYAILAFMIAIGGWSMMYGLQAAISDLFRHITWVIALPFP